MDLKLRFRSATIVVTRTTLDRDGKDNEAYADALEAFAKRLRTGDTSVLHHDKGTSVFIKETYDTATPKAMKG